jgi:hypothetical protein
MSSSPIEIADSYDLQTTIENPDVASWNITCDRLFIYYLVPENNKKILVESIGKSTTLKVLELEPIRNPARREKTDFEVDWLCAALKQTKSLTKLTLTSMKDSHMQELAEALKQNSSVTRIYFNITEFTVNGTKFLMDALRYNKNITKIYMSDFNIEQTIELWRDYLAQTTTLKNCKLTSVNLNEKCAEILFEGLKKNSSINTMDLFDNPIGEKVIDLVDIVLSKTYLKRLYISFVEVNTPSRVEAVCKLLKANHLDRLAINGCFKEEDSEGLDRVLEALQHDRTLNFLSANVIFMNDKQGVKLGKWLKKSPSVKTLRISVNQLGEEASKSIGNAIKYHPTLQRLSLDENPFEGDSIRWICEGLKSNSSLQLVDMARLPASTIEAITYVSDMLKANDSLTRFVLYTSFNPLTEEMVDLVVAAVLENNSLEMCEISYDKHIDKYMHMRAKLEQNRKEKHQILLEWLILMHNLARSPEAFEVFPSEIWLSVFECMRYRGINTFADTARETFRKVKRMQQRAIDIRPKATK